MLRGGTHVCPDSSSHGHGHKMTVELIQHFYCNTLQLCSLCVHVSLHKHRKKCILFHHVPVVCGDSLRDQCLLQIASASLLTSTPCLPQSTFMDLWFSEETLTVSLSSINWLLFCGGSECFMWGRNWTFIPYLDLCCPGCAWKLK